MKLSELLKNIEVSELRADPALDISGLSYDSRSTQPGDAFVAISGFETDGYKYIPSAAEHGAALIVCDRVPPIDTPYVLTPDCRKALALMSCEFFGNPSQEMTVIGVTGTNGKTTTTYLLKHLLETALNAKVGLIGTNGNMIGEEFIHSERTTPESFELQKLFREMKDAGCTHVVMEVSSHSLELHRVAGIDFDIGVFTNLTRDHLDFHKTMENYAEAKAKLFRMCKIGCVNMDDDWHEVITEDASCKIFSYSAENNAADLVAKDIRLSPAGVRFCTVTKDDLAITRLGIPGQFSVYNALGVVAVGVALGLSLSACAEALRSAKGVKGRMEVVPTDGNYHIVIDYAHTPDALENALKALRVGHNDRLVVLFGCGGDRDRTKRPIMGKIASEFADFAIITSDNPRTEDPQAIINEITAGIKGRRSGIKVIRDRREAIKWAIDNHIPNDVILLAGKGHEDYQVIGTEKIHMDEREIVAEHIEKRKEK